MTPEVQAAVTTPIVAAAAVGALLLLFVTSGAAGAFGTVAHESGHMVVGILTGHTVRYFEVTIGGEGATHWAGWRWGPGRILTTVAGYVTPPLLGLGGAALFDAGQIPLLLWTAVVLLVLTLFHAEREWTTFAVLLLTAATGYVVLSGTPLLNGVRRRARVAAAVRRRVLGGGSRQTERHRPRPPFRDTFIPRTLWKLGFIVVAVVCMWKGAQLMVP